VGMDAAGGFLQYADGQRIPLGSLVPTAINTGRQVVGHMPVGSVNHAVLWQHGMITDIGLLLADTTVPSAAMDISEDGVIVGYFGPGTEDTRGFVYHYGGIQIIPYSTPTGRIYPLSVNNVGQVLGYWGVTSRIHPFVWENGVLASLQDQMGLFSMALSINDKGQVAGFMPGGPGGEACIWIGATQYDISTLIQPNDSDSWILRGAWGINIHGQIAASATDSAGDDHAVLLTPLNAKEIALRARRSKDKQRRRPGYRLPSSSLYTASVLAAVLAHENWRARSRPRAIMVSRTPASSTALITRAAMSAGSCGSA
jgi:uncharacterized membrane protein